jgi:hypothetical protein
MAAAKKKESKRGRKPSGGASVKEQILNLFKKDADKEFDAAAVIQALKADSPKINEGSVRSNVAGMKSAGWLTETRKEGRVVFMKLNPNPPAAGSTLGVGTGRGRSASSGSFKQDLALFKEAASVLGRLHKMLERNEAVSKRIDEFKKSL